MKAAPGYRRTRYWDQAAAKLHQWRAVSKGHVHEGRELCLQDMATVRAEACSGKALAWSNHGGGDTFSAWCLPHPCSHRYLLLYTLRVRLMWIVCIRHDGASVSLIWWLYFKRRSGCSDSHDSALESPCHQHKAHIWRWWSNHMCSLGDHMGKAGRLTMTGSVKGTITLPATWFCQSQEVTWDFWWTHNSCEGFMQTWTVFPFPSGLCLADPARVSNLAHRLDFSSLFWSSPQSPLPMIIFKTGKSRTRK